MNVVDKNEFPWAEILFVLGIIFYNVIILLAVLR